MDAVTNPTAKSETPIRWRDSLAVHPACELFPLMSPTEISDLADDIKKNGLRETVGIYNDPVIGDCVLDGRNRLDALRLIGQLWDETGKLRKDIASLVGSCSTHYPNFDPYAYVISKNIKRRHLTAEQKRDIIAKVLKAKPSTSNNQIAKQVKVDDETVAKVRTELESTSDIPKLKMTIGRDGRARPVRKASPAVRHVTNAKPAPAPKPDTNALDNFAYAARHWLPKMSEADQRRAVKLVTEIVLGGES
jgi:hypothetical protein